MKNKDYAFQVGVWIFGVICTTLGFGLVMHLQTTVVALRSMIVAPFIPGFVLTAFAYLLPLLLLSGGALLFIPKLRLLAYHLLAFGLGLVGFAQLFMAHGPDFRKLTYVFVAAIALMITMSLDSKISQ